MYKIVILVALLGCAFGNPLVENDPENFVLGGVNAGEGQFPWTASVRVQNDFYQGVVLNENHVLTAARACTSGNRSVNHFWIRVMAGDLHITGGSWNREERTLSHLFIHDGFNYVTGVNNIAVLRLAHPFPFPHNTIEGAIRNTRIVPANTAAQFAGWQIPIPGEENLRFLRTFTINTITDAMCISTPGNLNRILTNMFCAGQLAPAPTNSICQGNIGGGLYLNRELIGIIHDGLTCNQANHPSIFMDVRFYNTWIDQTFNRTDLTPPGTEFPRPTPTAQDN